MSVEVEILPPLDSIAEFFKRLLDREVSVQPGKLVVPDPRTVTTVAEFSNGENQSCLAWVSDLAISSYIGAAHARISHETVSEGIKNGTLDESLAKSLKELFSSAVSLFEGPDKLQLELVELRVTPARLPARVVHAITRSHQRLDLMLKIEDYGQGEMSLCLREPEIKS